MERKVVKTEDKVSGIFRCLEQKARTVVHRNVATILGRTKLVTSNGIST